MVDCDGAMSDSPAFFSADVTVESMRTYGDQYILWAATYTTPVAITMYDPDVTVPSY